MTGAAATGKPVAPPQDMLNINHPLSNFLHPQPIDESIETGARYG